MQGKYLVVESLGRQFTLRDGDTTTCIFNDSYPDIEADPLELTVNEMEDVSEESGINISSADSAGFND